MHAQGKHHQKTTTLLAIYLIMDNVVKIISISITLVVTIVISCITCVVGRSGSGKSSIMNVILRMMEVIYLDESFPYSISSHIMH